MTTNDADNPTPASVPTSTDDAAPLSPSWAVSICFWCALLLAAAVYATVALAPKFAVWNRVRHEHLKNAEQLVALEDDVDYLERVEKALETDPEFVDRLAGMSGQTADDDTEYIPVSGTLLFGYEQMSAAATLPDEPPYHQLIMTLASRRPLRRGLLIFAAALTILAFTFLNDAGTNLVYGTGRLMKTVALMPVRRYTTPRPPAAPEHTESPNSERRAVRPRAGSEK
ncbi:MAG: hypothetical protein RIK87_27570 [Fuerstiella sp.]